MRVLITGSRNWDNRRIFNATLNRVVVDVHWDKGYDAEGYMVDWLVPYDFVLVHGGCPTGADAMADDFMGNYDRTCETHPAEWDKYGKRAGFLRNAEMVAAGADLCIAFIRDNSAGATMTANLAEQARIPTLRIRETARADAA